MEVRSQRIDGKENIGENVLPEEWHDERRPGKAKTACRGACTTMVHHCGHAFEKPLVRAVVDEYHTVVVLTMSA